jgi:ribonuclease E
MANSTSVAAKAAPMLSDKDLSRVRDFTREPILLEGESYEDLAPGSARRLAIAAALTEIEAGAENPSPEWRREYSLVLGLERLLADEPPVLNDGATLNEHQVDALSGTLAAMTAEVEKDAGIATAAADKAAAELAAQEPEPEPARPASSASPNGTKAKKKVRETYEGEDEDDLDDDDDEDLSDVIDEEEAEEEEEGEAPEPDEILEDEEEPVDWVEEPDTDEEEVVGDAEDDPGADRRFWFEHATGAGKTVAAVGFVDASRTGGILILTHRRNLVDQFIGEISSRGYKERLCPPLLDGADHPYGPVTVETYQWFVRNASRISDAYSIVICDEAHTALGEKTSACIRQLQGPVFIGMTATGALIARHVADLFPTQTSRFDLAQAARRGVIAPLRCIRIPPGPGVRTLANVPLRRGEVDQDFDQEELAKLLNQAPFNVAIADLYKTRFRKVPGVLYTAGVAHANNVAAAMRDVGINARAVSGETPKRELAEILAGFERGEVDVLCNAMLLAEGWNSPRATICMHLAPTASRRIYQQRVGRVTRRSPGKEAGLVIDLVHPATTSDEPIVTLHSLLDRDVYRGGAIVVGPVRRGRGRRVRVERRVLPVSGDPERRLEVLERDLWRIAVENLNYTEQHAWAALAGARVTTNQWRRAKAMIQHDEAKELRRRFLLTCVQRNRNHQLKLKALAEVAALRDAEAFDDCVEIVATWPRDDRRSGAKVLLQALAERRIGRRDQAQAWVWRLAEITRELHEQYAVQRWPETKRLLGLFVNSSGRAHGRNARRLVTAARQQDRRLSVALLAAAVAHTPEAEEVLRGARMRMARKPSGVARELLRNFPKPGGSKRRRKRRGKSDGNGSNGQDGNRNRNRGRNGNGNGNGGAPEREKLAPEAEDNTNAESVNGGNGDAEAKPKPRRRRKPKPKSENGSSSNGGSARSSDEDEDFDAKRAEV